MFFGGNCCIAQLNILNAIKHDVIGVFNNTVGMGQ